MTQGARNADICTRLGLMVRALVTDRNAVSVTSLSTPSGDPVIVIKVHPQDLGYVMGKENAVAHSLSVLLECIGERHGVRYGLSIKGDGLPQDLPGLPDWSPMVEQIPGKLTRPSL